MRHVALVVCASLAFAIPLSSQASSPPQSARQALIEMFFGKGADDFARHLPDDARHALVRQGDNPQTSTVLRLSTIGREISTGGQNLETFDVGPNILVADVPQSHQRIEIGVEHDSVIGEEEEIELSLHIYKDGQLKTLPVVPRFTFTMKQQKEVWRLTNLTFTAQVPLTDPDYLKELRQEQDEANESAAQMRISMIAMAETQYAASHPDRGYICSLGALFTPEPITINVPSGSTAQQSFADPGLGNNEYSGYRFTLKGCDGSPAMKYQATAAPIDDESAGKSFCVNESGALKFTTSANSNCFNRGEAVNAGVVSTDQQ